MKYVNRIVGKDGVERLYFRKAGLPSVPLKSPMPPKGQEKGSALEREVSAILGGAPEKPLPRTIKAATRAYELESASWAVLADSTKYEYGLILKEFDADLGDLQQAAFTSDFVFKLQNAWAKRGHRAAENRLVVLRHVLLPYMIKTGSDPFAMLPAVPRSREADEPHRIWPEGVVHKVIARALRGGKIGLARGVALGRYAGMRRGDLVKVTRAIRKAGKLAWLSGKRRVPVNIEEDAALKIVLDGTSHHPGSVILAYNVAGGAYTEDGFGLEVGKITDELFAEGEIDTAEYNVHGLRHTFGVEAALAGCTDAEGAARMGHKSPSSFAQYRRQADRIRLAANADEKLKQFRERTSNEDLQNDLQNICKTAPSRTAKPRGKAKAKSTC